MLRWRCQYFYWIPLSERCKFDLNIILIQWAEHLFWIYSKYVQVGLKWNVGLKPQQLCHTPSLMDINRSMLEVIFTHPSHQILSPHLIGSITLEALLHPHVGKLQQEDFCFWPRVFQRIFDQHWLWSTLGQIDPKLGRNFDFLSSHFLALKSRLTIDFDRATLTLLLLLFVLTVD